MISERLYYEEPYKRECEAKVVLLSENGIILDKTIFYPEGGGQKGDRGTFGDYVIVDTQKENDEIVHIIKGKKPDIGQVSKLTLDFDHRYSYMKEHSAQHLVSAVLYHLLGIGTLSVHLSEDFITIETDRSHIEMEDILRVEDEANRRIRENRRIWREEMTHKEADSLNMRRSIKVDGDVKVVFIDGVDAVACGGVHVASTSEIGEVSYYKSESVRGHVRLYFKVGDDSKRLRREDRLLRESLSALLSRENSSDIESDVRNLICENDSQKKKIKSLEEDLARLILDKALSQDNRKAIILVSDVPSEAFQRHIDKTDRETLFILDRSEKHGFVFYGDSALFMRLKSELDLRGGGKNRFFRGSYALSAEDALEKAERIIYEEG